MSNSFYNHGAFPSTGSAATSASMRAELDLVAAGFDKMPTLSGNANKFIIVNSTGTALTQTDVLPAFTVTDTDFTVQDDGDNTRKFQFNAGSITTGNTRVYVMPDLDTTLVGTNVTQTLTNKTLTAPVIATIVNTGTLTLPTSTDTLVGRNTTDTLTNKTLTNPVIGTIVNTGTLTLPTSTDTLVGRQTTDTLTNKTISGASNTLSNIANGSLSNSSIVIGSTTLSLGGTMTTLAGVTISGASNTLSNIANASLTNSSITINGSTVALGSSVTVTATATNALTIGNGLSGTSYNGSSAVTIAINTGVTADLSTAQTFSNKTISGSANTLSNIANASLTNSAITIGSTAISLGATSLTIAGLTSASATTLISTGNQATSVAISAIGHSSGTVTVTTSTAHGLTTGDTASIDGVADYTFCGVYTVTVTNANVFTYSQTASGASSSGGFSTKLSGTWGLYAGGTGPSLANGPVMINASSQMPALRVTQGGSGYALIVEDAANPDTSAFIISNAGDLAINTNKFTVAAASGNTVIAGTTSLNGNVTFATDATYDIGASGATRPRDLFLSRNLVVGGTLTLAGGVNLNGNVTIGDASTDTLTINSTITSNLIFTDNTYDIGASGATRPRSLFLGTNLSVGARGAFGTTAATNYNLRISTNPTGATSVWGIYQDGVIQSDVTANYVANNVSLNTAAAAFTLSNFYSYLAQVGSIGAGSAITNAHGFYVDSNFVGATNTYGFYSTLASATGRWNFYAAGTANNAFAGNVRIGSTTAPTNALDVTGSITISGNTTLGDAAADNVTVNGTITSNLIFTDNTYDIGATAATRPRTGYFGTSVNVQSGQNAYGLLVGPTTGAWSVGGYTGIAFLIRNTGGGGVGGDQGGAYIQGYQPTSGNTGGLKFITRSDASTTTTRYTIDETGISTWSVGSNATSMSLTATGLGLNQAAGNGTLTILKSSTYSTESSAAICLNSVNTNGYTSLQIGVDDAINSAYIQSVAKGTSYTTKFLLLNPNGGNVGIGNITTPGNLLTVAKTGAAATVQIIANTASQNAQVVLTSTVASWYVGQNITEASTGSLEFYNGSKAMSIGSNGAVYFTTAGTAGTGSANIANTEPFLRFSRTGGTADKSKWDIRAIAASAAAYDNILQFRTVNDANSTFRTMATIGWDGVVAVNPDQTNTGPLMRVYGGGTSQRGAYWSSDGTLSGGATNYWEFGRDNATTGDFTFSLNTSTFWRMTTAGQWNRKLTTDLTAISVQGSYTGNPELIAIGQSSSDGFIRISDAVGNATFLTGYNVGTSYFAGRLSLGTTGTNARFTATTAIDTWAGWFQQRSNAGNSVVMAEYSSGAPNTSTDYFLLCRDTGGQKVRLHANGGIANFQANDVNLSDRREKTNFAPAKSYLDVICAIPVQTFNYIDQNMEEDGGLTLGVVAQDVQAVAPELVMESDWGPKGTTKMRLSIYQTDLQYALMKALQELKADFDAYKASHP